MTRHSSRIVFVVCGVLGASAFAPSTADAQQATAARTRDATRAVTPASQASAAQAAAAQPAAPVPVQARAAQQYARPASAVERAAISTRLSRGDCVQPSYVMSVSRMFDNRPLERPKPLTIVKGDRDATMSRVSTVFRSNGFAEVSSNIDSGELLVSRPDAANPGARDDILVWADGQAGDADRIRLYLQYGRFERVWGSTTPERVVLPPDEVQTRIGAVRQAISNLASGAP